MARVLFVVSGGIAAYKAPEVVRGLRKAGHEVRVVRTAGAAHFVADLALATVSGHPVHADLFDPEQELAGVCGTPEGAVGHVALADWAEVVLVAPATAHVLARMALGLADDLATTLLLATRAPVLAAPAMNVNMWRHPAVQGHVETLKARGVRVVGPAEGDLACGWEGPGRMVDPPVLVDAVGEVLAGRLREWASLRGRRVLVTAGPTRTYLDAVRFVTNASSGTMGFAVAAEAARRGAEVVLVTGPVSLGTPPGVHRVDVETAREMYAAVMDALSARPTDLAVMAAAVSDLEVAADRSRKLPKDAWLQGIASLAVQHAPDILAEATARFGDRTFFVGFAAETVPEGALEASVLVEKGRRKRARKGCPALFVNRVGTGGRGFGPGANTGVLLLGEEVRDHGALTSKRELAAWLLDQVAPAMAEHGRAVEARA